MSQFVTKEEYQEYFDTDSRKIREELLKKLDDRLDDVITKIFEANGRKRPKTFWYDEVEYEYSYENIRIGAFEELPYFDVDISFIPIEWLFSDDFVGKIQKQLKNEEKKKQQQKQKRKEYMAKKKLMEAELAVYRKQLKKKYGIR